MSAIIRTRRGFYAGEDGGAYEFVKRRQNALRLTREQAERLIGFLNAYWGPATIEECTRDNRGGHA